MKRLLVFIVTMMFLVLTSCDESNFGDISFDTSDKTSIEETTIVEETSTRVIDETTTTNETSTDVVEESVEKEQDKVYVGYHKHYLVDCCDGVVKGKANPKIINNSGELVAFAQEYIDSEEEKSKIINNISSQTFEDYFVIVVFDTIFPGGRPTDDLVLRAYKGFTVTNNQISIYVSSYYDAFELHDPVERLRADMILIPREFYSENLEDKTFKIYMEENDHNQCNDPPTIMYWEISKDRSEFFIKKGDEFVS